jgi:hypothetical protein
VSALHHEVLGAVRAATAEHAPQESAWTTAGVCVHHNGRRSGGYLSHRAMGRVLGDLRRHGLVRSQPDPYSRRGHLWSVPA